MFLDNYEKSFMVTYKESIYDKFIDAIDKHQLIKPKDSICICISGGKDSMLLARLFMQLEKENRYDFTVKYLVMNPGYNQKNMDLIKENLSKLSIPAEIVETDIFEIAGLQDRSPCFLCAKMRRGALYNFAKARGCNKIALGHHFDDVIETTLMNMLNSGSFQTMLPKLKSTNYEGMEVIRPLYLVREKDIINWKNDNDLKFILCACKFTEESAHASDGVGESQRAATKKLIKELEANYNKDVAESIFKSAENVILDGCTGYHNMTKYYSLLDDED